MIKSKIDWLNKNVLVTGGTGLIGRQVVKLLHQAGAYILTTSLAGADSESAAEIAGHARHRRADLTDFETCKDLADSVDYVFHLAGLKGSVLATKKRPADYFVPMLQMNTNMLEACRLAGVKKVVYASSIGAYAPGANMAENTALCGDPMDEYPGWAKRMGEYQLKAYKQQYDLSWTAVRFCNVYGPGGWFDRDAMVIFALMTKIYEHVNPVEVWGDGRAVRDFLYAEDAARGVMLAVDSKEPLLNIGSGIGYSIQELVFTLRKVVPFNFKFNVDQPEGYSSRILNTNLIESLGFKQKVPLQEGLERTWKWLIEHKPTLIR